MKRQFILYRFEMDEFQEKTQIVYLSKTPEIHQTCTPKLSEARKVGLFTALLYTVFSGFSFVSERFARSMQ